jgi:undecaprenyl diphosphate synthase
MSERIEGGERYPGFPDLGHLDPSDFPKHTVIIMDGNRHFGEEHFGDKLAGHAEGAKTAVKLLRAALPLPGEVLTFWGFAADNWRREETEVDQLMLLMTQTIQQNAAELQSLGIRFAHLGRKDRIPQTLAATIKDLEEATKDNDGKILCAAIDFGGTDQDILLNQQTARTAIQIARTMPHLTDEEIARTVDEEWLRQNRDTTGRIGPADLIIRPQHFRTSDIGWLNGPSTEICFFPDLQFPDMTPAHLEAAILQYTRDVQNHGK